MWNSGLLSIYWAGVSLFGIPLDWSLTRNGYWLGQVYDDSAFAEIKLYPDRSLYQWTEYSGGKKQFVLRFWQNGKMMSQISYAGGRKHGVVSEWNRNGTLAALRSYRHGREVGWQKEWDQKGELYSNYFVKEGRAYGLVNARSCQTGK